MRTHGLKKTLSTFKPLEQTSSAIDHSVTSLPSLIVFDLDNTLWTPELYQLRRLPGYADASGPGPVARKDVNLFPAAEAILSELATDVKWKQTLVAVASRTNKASWARSLLKQFQVSSVCLDDFIVYKEIFQGEKTRHFELLCQKTNIRYEDMLFFDDAKGGKFGNCEAVSKLGVMSAHCPEGLTFDIWTNAIRSFHEFKTSGKYMGCVVDPPSYSNIVSVNRQASVGQKQDLQRAAVKLWREDKSFGFCRLTDTNKEIFFHRSAISLGGSFTSSSLASTLTPGTPLAVRVGVGKDGRPACTIVTLIEDDETEEHSGTATSLKSDEKLHSPSKQSPGSVRSPFVTLPCFSMNQPFAGLVAHGFKTLETRNSTVFTALAGKRVALHVGQRTYPDGGMHREIMRRASLSEQEIDRLTSLPPGFTRGHVVAVLEVGDTVLVERQGDRENVQIELGAVATGAAMGRYLTTIKSARWLKPPGLPLRGQPGVFSVDIPEELFAKSSPP